MKYKVIFFPDELHDSSRGLKDKLGKSCSCFMSNNPDEFSQSYHQTGKFVLLFSDAVKAVNFIRKMSKPLEGLEFKTYAYLNKNGKFSPDSQKILNENNINVFTLSESAKLMVSIEHFFSGHEGEGQNIDDLQFVVPKDE